MAAGDHPVFELRRRAREGEPEAARAAQAELRRRLDNLCQGGLVPAWERRARGADTARWRLW